jgi:hypothetical protein
LVHDWLGLLNAGHKIAPIGSSDSHDVSRFIVGQGRTYVRLKRRDPGNIDVAAAVKNIAAGHTIASLGMIVDLTVNDDYGPGDVLTTERKGLEIRVRVLGPRWSQPQRVTVFANGYKMHSWEIPSSRVYVGWKEGVWLDEVLRFATLNTVTDDMHLVAVAEGAGVDELFWPTPRPYQPTSTAWKSYGVAVSGPVFVDWDGTPGFASPADYARQMVDGASGDMREIARRLSDRDVSINHQVAALLMQRGLLFTGDNLRTLRAELSAAGRQPIDEYVAEWKEHEVAEQKP